MSLAYVALGANLGDPASTVRAAFGALANLPDSRVLRCSSLYRTAPVGVVDQPEFINAVALLETTLAPQRLLAELLDIECRFGRQRAEKNGPRTLDLDLLLYDERCIELPELILPHPRLHLRAFVLLPLAEIAPDLVLPGRGRIAAWLPAVANQSIVRL
ncbi:MAG TPA: 2-amino-4-hydroxy-6-hydroxymethyldihydropteridine diphosphokinase [Azonexus sp.]